jgi:hypothetical protein
MRLMRRQAMRGQHVQRQVQVGGPAPCVRAPAVSVADYDARRSAGVCVTAHTSEARHTVLASLNSHENCHENRGAPTPSCFVSAFRGNLAGSHLVGSLEFAVTQKGGDAVRLVVVLLRI